MHDLLLMRLDAKVISLMSSEAALSLTKLLMRASCDAIRSIVPM
jgi:hypothetical protein